MDTALWGCAGCQRAFAADDAVVLVVPFVERGSVVRMGDELVFHEACEPHHAGLRVVGRGNHGEILEGFRGDHSDVIDAENPADGQARRPRRRLGYLSPSLARSALRSRVRAGCRARGQQSHERGNAGPSNP